MSCEWNCQHCKVDMISISNGITWCPNCGKITSMVAPPMMPKMSHIIFEAKRAAGKEVPEGKIKVVYGPPDAKPKLKVIS